MKNTFTYEKKLHFPDRYLISKDKGTIMGETIFKDILFLDYRDTEAGSNPREYNGLKKTNLEILKSVLVDYKNMFRFLHSGTIVSLTGLKEIDKDSISYENCCLTNGNQTRFIILILTLLKLYSQNHDINKLEKTSFNKFIKDTFNESEVSDFLFFLKFVRVSEILNGFLKDNGKYFDLFKKMDLNEFLNSKIRISVNVLDRIIEGIETLDEYKAGTLIANANNDTQNVKVDDIFGSKHKKELETHLFKEFTKKYGDTVKIEYRMGEIPEKKEKVHILTLLRPVIATGILTKENEIFKLSNQRAAIYSKFIKLFRNLDKAQKTTIAISKIIPLLYNTRETYVTPLLKLTRDRYYREYTEKALMGELENSSIGERIKVENGDLNEDSKKVIKSITNHNIEHIFPVIVYTIRNLIALDSDGNAELKVPSNECEKFFKSLISTVYKKYIELKLQGATGSITDIIRKPDFFKSGDGAYETLKTVLNLKESSFVKDNGLLNCKISKRNEKWDNGSNH